MLVSYYLPGNRPAPPPAPLAYGPPLRTEEEQSLFDPLPYGGGVGGGARLFYPSRMEGGWEEEQYKADHEHYSMYYDLLCRSSSINNALFQMTAIDFDHFRHSKRVETAHLIMQV